MIALAVLWLSVSVALLFCGLMFAAYEENVDFILRFVLFCLFWPIGFLFFARSLA